MAEIGIKIGAIDNTRPAFQSISKSMGALQSSAGGLVSTLATLGVGLSVGGFLALTKGAIDGIDALNDLKDATGASIENISALEDVARRTGTSLDTVGSALVKMNQALNTAKPGSDAERAITALGLSVKDLKAQDPAEAFRKIAVAMSGFADDGHKARLTQELFGKSLKEVAPLLKNVAENGALVATVTTEQAEAAEAFNKQLSALEKNFSDVGRSILSKLLPSLLEVSKAFADGTKAGKGFLEIANDRYWENIGKFYDRFRDGPKEFEERLAKINTTLKSGQLLFVERSALLREQAELQEKLSQQRPLDPNNESSAEARRLSLSGNAARPTVGDVLATTKDTKAIKENTQARKDQQERIRLGREYAIADGEAVMRANDAYQKSLQDDLKERERYNDALGRSADKVQAQVQALQDEATAADIAATQNITLAQAIEQVEIARLREAQAAELSSGNEEAAAALQREINARKELATLIDSKEARVAGAKAAKDAADEWGKAAEKINDSITDALMRGFENGKDFAENLRDTVVNMFKTMVLRPVVSAIVSPLAATLAGNAFAGGGTVGSAGAAAGQGGGLGALSTIKGAYESVSGGFASSISSISATMGKWLIENTTGMLQRAGVQLYAKAGSIGTAGAYVGGALAGYGIGSAISGNKSAFGDGNGDVATLAGTAIGAFFGGPIGAAIGGSIGGLVNRAFGQGPKESTGSGITGTFSGSAFSGQSFNDWRRDGGWFSSASTGTDYNPLGSGMSQSLGNVYGQITSQTAALAAALGAPTEQITGYVKTIRLNTGSDSAAAITKIFENIADELASTIVSAQYIKDAERASAALARMVSSLATVNTAFAKLDKSLVGASLAGGDAASKLIDLLGGSDQFNASTLAYYQTYYSESERNAKTAQELSDSFAALGAAKPETLDAFRALVNAQDITTESGRTMYAALMGLSGAFATVTTAASEAATALIKTMNYATYADYAAAASGAGSVAAPRFAAGGMHTGGLRLVGENGPELEATGPARIWNAAQLGGALGADQSEIKALREDTRAQARAITTLTAKMVKIFDTWDVNGMPEVRTV